MMVKRSSFEILATTDLSKTGKTGVTAPRTVERSATDVNVMTL